MCMHKNKLFSYFFKNYGQSTVTYKYFNYSTKKSKTKFISTISRVKNNYLPFQRKKKKLRKKMWYILLKCFWNVIILLNALSLSNLPIMFLMYHIACATHHISKIQGYFNHFKNSVWLNNTCNMWNSEMHMHLRWIMLFNIALN